MNRWEDEKIMNKDRGTEIMKREREKYQKEKNDEQRKERDNEKRQKDNEQTDRQTRKKLKIRKSIDMWGLHFTSTQRY